VGGRRQGHRAETVVAGETQDPAIETDQGIRTLARLLEYLRPQFGRGPVKGEEPVEVVLKAAREG